MISKVFRKIVGTRHDRNVRRLSKIVYKANALEDELAALDDASLRGRTEILKERSEAGASLDDLLPEAFAAVREAGKRVLNMRHFDVQFMGGMVLHQGRIAEMRTGEGKTLVATLPVYLNALSGRGVHVVTVNEYLAQRDAEWMRPLYEFLGLSVGVILSGQSPEEKRSAYAADVTYGTNNEFGFDYLRDNMAFQAEDKVQRPLNFAIVDEVDSILIDEARTPLIISGSTDENTELYRQINSLIPGLEPQQTEDGPGDFSIDEKTRQVHLTDAGHQRVETLLADAGLLPEGQSLYDASNILLMHHVNAGLRAHHLFNKDVHYIVQNGKVVIVDEFTGRTMPGRRWSDGLHQAIEAKESLAIQSENQTLASITFQNYFRLYDKLAGMTGTADTEAYEFQQIYGLEVVVIPTNKPMVREDYPDQIYMTKREKFDAIAKDIQACRNRQQPVLVGTTSIENSELLSRQLTKLKIPHEVLNAKQHAREAEIIAQAGRPGAVTIATNMAGRGTDIVLGGNPEMEIEALGEEGLPEQIEAIRAAARERQEKVLESGGLHIIGSERHESRRVDNQLRGRAGRQGDHGSSRFYLCLEDDLLRIFGSGRLTGLMQRLGMEEGESIEHPWVTRAIENAQRKVEGHNFDIRKQLLEYDDVANDQRRVIYEQRNELLAGAQTDEMFDSMRADVVEELISQFIPPQSVEEQWDVAGLEEHLTREYQIDLPIKQWLEQEPELNERSLRARILEALTSEYNARAERIGPEVMQQIEKSVMLRVLDGLWREHLAAMDYLRQGIHLRGYAQKNPKQEYKREAFEMFSEMLERFKHDAVGLLYKIHVRDPQDVEAIEEQRARPTHMQFRHPGAASPESVGEEALPATGTEGAQAAQPFVRGERKVGRNEPCPCGSGKKFKQCHGRLT